MPERALHGPALAANQHMYASHPASQCRGFRLAVDGEHSHHAAVHVVAEVAVEEPRARVVCVGVQHPHCAGLYNSLRVRYRRHCGSSTPEWQHPSQEAGLQLCRDGSCCNAPLLL